MKLIQTLNHNEASQEAANLIFSAIERKNQANQFTDIALCGGNTPVLTYKLLTEADLDWSRVRIWLSDERFVPQNDPLSNALLVKEKLINNLTDTQPHLFTYNTDLDPQRSARQYATTLNNTIGKRSQKIPVIDIALLGVGEDGHTASLFPNSQTLNCQELCCVEYHSPKPPPIRMSFSLPLLHIATTKIFLATGKEKKQVLKSIISSSDKQFPASLVIDKNTVVVTDQNITN